jgi:hypothetical protein
MNVDKIRELNKKALKGSKALSDDLTEELEDSFETFNEDLEESVTEMVPALKNLANDYPVLFPLLVFLFIVSIVYSVGLYVKPSFVLYEQNGEMVVNRYRLAVLSGSLAVLTSAVLTYML